MTSISIDLLHVTKHFPKSTLPALGPITCRIPSGSITGIIGADGSGKTTLMRLLAALLLPTEGKIRVEGYDSVTESEKIHEIASYMPQKFGLYEDLTVSENLELYAELKGLKQDDKAARFMQLLTFTGLSPFQKRFAKDLSGGMKQKLGLACALVTQPKVLLLDEPSVGVDPISRRELWKMVLELLSKEITVLWSTSYLDEAQRCHNLLLLNEGHLLYQGPFHLMPNPSGKEGVSFEEKVMSQIETIHHQHPAMADLTPYVREEMEEMIVAKNLTKKFGNFIAADNISFTVKKGEIFGLIGPNGAGKSTTFKMLCGLLKPTEGSVLVAGFDTQVAKRKSRLLMGYMAQKFSLYGNLSVLQNLIFFSGIYNLTSEKQKEAINKMIAMFELEAYLQTNAEMLPLGFKQRLALACANMHHPAVLFLDEATSGVDPVTRKEFWSHIRGLVSKGVTIMVTTHFMDEAEYCDRIALIYRGKMVALESPAKLKEMVCTDQNPNPTLEDAFIAKIGEYDALHPAY